MSKAVLMKRNLVLPSAGNELDREEMIYVEGGLSIPMSGAYVVKASCVSKINGYALIELNGRSYSDAAMELFAHAVAYYSSPFQLFMLKIAIGSAAAAMVDYIKSRANPCDIGGDNLMFAYQAIWLGAAIIGYN